MVRIAQTIPVWNPTIRMVGERERNLNWENFHPMPGFEVRLTGDHDQGLNGQIELWAGQPNALAAQWLELCGAA